MTRDAAHECPACGLRSKVLAGPTHPYMRSSPGCWAAFGEVLARNGADPMFQLATDAYAVSQPGDPSDRRAVQSVPAHLILLHLVVEDGVDPVARHVLLRRMSRPASFPRLDPPPLREYMTAADVLAGDGPGQQLALIGRRAEDVWAAWAAHHASVRTWIQTGLGSRTALRG